MDFNLITWKSSSEKKKKERGLIKNYNIVKILIQFCKIHFPKKSIAKMSINIKVWIYNSRVQFDSIFIIMFLLTNNDIIV